MILENTTRDKIFYTSFKLFLENGYEATNIRDICEEVGIKASTVYFYYKSKQNLFTYIYDEICNDYMRYLQSIEDIEQDISIKEKLYIILKKKIEYYVTDISKQKFILRYHLFPPEEMSKIIREKYKYYIKEENKIIINILGKSSNKNELLNEDIEGYLFENKKVESHLVYEMLLTNVKVSEEITRKAWYMAWDNINKVEKY